MNCKITDSELILNYLKSNPGWQPAAQIMRDLKPNAVGWAMRSRISCDLNKRILPPKGLIIESRLGENGMAEYRLVTINNICNDEIVPIKFEENGQGVWI